MSRLSLSRIVVLPLIFLSLLLTGCKKDLYQNLAETDANEILVALLEGNVKSAEKNNSSSGKAWSVSVDESDIVTAMQILREKALPRNHFEDLGELFKRDGLVSTPIEDRVRFVYGISQELSSTLSKIDGVLVARVHIVLPNNDPLAEQSKPSSASVFIKASADSNVNRLIPQIKGLVSHSVEGLVYDQVNVTVVPSEQAKKFEPRSNGWSTGNRWQYAAAAVAALLSVILIGFWFRKNHLLMSILRRRKLVPTQISSKDSFGDQPR